MLDKLVPEMLEGDRRLRVNSIVRHSSLRTARHRRRPVAADDANRKTKMSWRFVWSQQKRFSLKTYAPDVLLRLDFATRPVIGIRSADGQLNRSRAVKALEAGTENSQT